MKLFWSKPQRLVRISPGLVSIHLTVQDDVTGELRIRYLAQEFERDLEVGKLYSFHRFQSRVRLHKCAG